MPDEYLPYREATVTGAQRAEYRALHKEWKAAALAAERGNDDGYSDIERLDIEENAAYTSLCDWVEENDLNYTTFDPRGPELVNPHAERGAEA